MRWERRLRKPEAEGGATLCEKHDFIAKHFGDPDMSWEVDQVISQAKDDGQLMEDRIKELVEEVTDLNDAWNEMKSDRDRLQAELDATRKELEGARFANEVLDSAAKDAQSWAYQLQECKAELARVRRNHLRRMISVARMRGRQFAQFEDYHKGQIVRFVTACRSALAQLQDKKANP